MHTAVPKAAPGNAAPPSARDDTTTRERRSAVGHLTRTVIALGSSVGVQSALGVAFTVAAARMFGASASGADLTMIAVARVLATVVQLNMTVVVHRILPTSPSPRQFVVRTYTITTALAVVVGVLVVAVAGRTSDVVHDLVRRPQYAIAFVAAVAFWNVFALQDIVLATLRHSRIVLIESVIYGLAGLACLIVLRALDVARPIFLAAFIPVVPLVLGVSWFVFRRAIPADLRLEVARRKVDIRRESVLIVGDTMMSTVEMLIRALTPILVADWLGTDVAAGFVVASAIGLAMNDLVTSIQRSFSTELSRYPEHRFHLLKRSVLLISGGVVPGALLLALGAPLILGVFGEEFVRATPFLRFTLLALIPASLTNVALTVARAQRSTKATVGSLIVAHSVTITLIVLLARDHGLVAIGVAQLIGWSAAFAVSWLFLVRQFWKPLRART
jgi:O-antigen/teichoic acid export membrane protein